MRRSAVPKRRTKTSPGPAPRPRRQAAPGVDKLLSRDRSLTQDTQQTVGFELRAILANPDTPASAKVNAARTLAEMDGLIGRHQIEPERQAPSLATLSRDQLIAELERLRTLCDLGLAG